MFVKAFKLKRRNCCEAHLSFIALQSTYDGPPKLIVFGGNGFVGTRVCEEALQTGLAVVSINRSGPPKATAAWTSDVEWVSVSSNSVCEYSFLTNVVHEEAPACLFSSHCLHTFAPIHLLICLCNKVAKHQYSPCNTCWQLRAMLALTTRSCKPCL